ncbi:hypothetical protein C8046_05615 [Serinibacter arcticus]|uniref:Predicted membrane protein YciQ-like C-terminal domain-containing protein n=1 Tax=Serinibacter arcticus TaxID=1655435 RepID=A0A2U1ZTA7_9MICO|nr:DUF2207 domain-containing protein [Serinibacter arcticus]PWD50218.1 hypothetical protein C8046_05615 [Serinibacter arcticus]
MPEGFRTEPPAGVPAGEFGTLIDERAQTHDVVAVLLDLAVRGVIHIEVVPATVDGDDEDGDDLAGDDLDPDDRDPDDRDPDDRDFQLVRAPGPHDLRPYERTLVEGIFGDEDVVLVSLASGEIAAAIAQAQKDLDDAVTEQGWFAGSPRRVRGRWYLAGIGLILAGLVGTAALALTVGWGLVGIAVLAVGIVTTAVAGSMPTRTARGSELTREAREFERFLTDVTSETPAWAAGSERLVPSVFEAYLPYAVALRLEQRWTDAFAGAVRRGELVQPVWFTSPAYLAYPGVWAMGDLGRSLGDLTSGVASATTVTAPGSGSSGGATWSGSVGGGVGGGGGGGW